MRSLRIYFRLALVVLGLPLLLAGCSNNSTSSANGGTAVSTNSSAESSPTSTATGPAAPATEPENPGATGAPQQLRLVDLHIDQATLHTEVAANETQREIGLMHVAKMGDNDGMIFLMPAVERVSFWMKDTLIPLSIAFIDPNGTILEIHDMKAMDTTTLNSDSTQVAYALETNLHWFALNGIKPGDHLQPAPATLGKPEP